MYDLGMKYHSYCQFSAAILISFVWAVATIHTDAILSQERKVSPELLKLGTHSSETGKARVSLSVLCLLILDHAGSYETLLSISVQQSLPIDDFLFMWHTPCVKVNDKLLGCYWCPNWEKHFLAQTSTVK